MPLTYSIDSVHKIVVANAFGILSIDDIFGYQREVWLRPLVRGFNELVDMTNVEAVNPPTADQLRSFSEFAASMDDVVGQSKLAIVAQGDLDYGLARMFQSFREMNPNSKKVISVFRSLKDALEYLGIGDPGIQTKT